MIEPVWDSQDGTQFPALNPFKFCSEFYSSVMAALAVVKDLVVLGEYPIHVLAEKVPRISEQLPAVERAGLRPGFVNCAKVSRTISLI